MQRGHHYAIVDEVDSILIDEARTPLIISGPTQDEVKWYDEFAKLATRLEQRRRLRGRREEAHHLGARARHHQGRGPPRHREPLRVGQHPADLLPQQLDQGQGAVPQRQGVRRHGRRGAHRRRAHRPHAGRPSLQRRPAPGDRGQGGRGGPRGVPDPRHGHPAELLPPLREALRHDRYGDDRGRRSSTRSTSSAWSRSRPTSRWSASTSPTSSTAPRRPSTTRSSTTSPSGTPRASRSWSAPSRSRSPSTSPSKLRKRGIPHSVLNAKQHADEAKIVAHGRPQGRGHGRHQHGRSRHRHHARRLGRVPRRRRSCASGASSPGRDRRGVRGRLAGHAREDQGAGRGRARRGQGRWAASTSSAPSATSRAASTTSCAAVPAARATRASRGSTCRSRTS